MNVFPYIAGALVLVFPGETATAQDRYQAHVPAVAQQQLQQAKSAYVAGQASDAVRSMSRLTASQPNYYAAQYNLGLALAESGKTKEGIAALEQARAIRERDGIADATIYNSLGWAYMLDGQLAPAEKAFETARHNEAQLSPESKARLYNNMGWLYMNTGRTDLARQSLQTAETRYGSSYATRNLSALEKLSASKAAAK